VKAAQRNLWIELSAIGMILMSLLLLLGPVAAVLPLLSIWMLPDQPPIQGSGIDFGPAEILLVACCFLAPALALWIAAWGLRSLLSAEDEGEGIG
jgi:hypothetical protein